jgi:hypothetical protein
MNNTMLKTIYISIGINAILMLSASVIATIRGKYLFWLFPGFLFVVFGIGYFSCWYMLTNREQYRKLLAFFAKFNPIAKIPNLEVYLPNFLLVNLALLTGLFSLMTLLAAIYGK